MGGHPIADGSSLAACSDIQFPRCLLSTQEGGCDVKCHSSPSTSGSNSFSCSNCCLWTCTRHKCGSRCPGTIKRDLAIKDKSGLAALFTLNMRSGALKMHEGGTCSPFSTLRTTLFLIHSDHSLMSDLLNASFSRASKKVVRALFRSASSSGS